MFDLSQLVYIGEGAASENRLLEVVSSRVQAHEYFYEMLSRIITRTTMPPVF